MVQYLSDFQKKHKSLNRSDNTGKTYSFAIEKFQQWLIAIAHLEKAGEPKLSHELLSDFINYLARHYSDETVRTARKVIKDFARWASEQGLLPPVAIVKAPETGGEKLHDNILRPLRDGFSSELVTHIINYYKGGE